MIGAGPAGTSAAALLQARGWSTAVVEAETFPRFVIGESLLARCMDLLDEAGRLDAVKARGYLVKRGALFVRGGERADIDFAEQFTPGWTWTWQVPRADFDLTLANEASRQGVPTYYQHRVTGMTPGAEPTLTVESSRGHRTLRARHVIDASGYGRVLPLLLGLDRPRSLPERKSVFAHVRGDRRPPGTLENRIWIVMHPRGAWIWLIPFSDGITSVGFVAEPSFFEHITGTDEEVFRAAIAEEPNTRARLAGMEFVFPPRSLRGYSATVTAMHGPGYTLVGNATEFLYLVFSSGVTLALESANRAARDECNKWPASSGASMRERTVTWTQDEELLHALAAGSISPRRTVESSQTAPFASFLTTLAFRTALPLLADTPVRGWLRNRVRGECGCLLLRGPARRHQRRARGVMPPDLDSARRSPVPDPSGFVGTSSRVSTRSSAPPCRPGRSRRRSSDPNLRQSV